MPRMPEAGERVTARELVVLVAGACLLAVVMHWPLVLHLGDRHPQGPRGSARAVVAGGLGRPRPRRTSRSTSFSRTSSGRCDDTLAFSDALVGYAPAGLLGSGPEAAVFRYDLLFLFAYALAFAGAYLLARELGLGPGGAAVAGAAFAFAPFRLEQDGHMQVISSGGIPLAFAARPARLPPPPAGVGGRGLGGRRLAALDRLHARPAARLPAGHGLADRRGRLAARGAVRASTAGWRSRPSSARRSSSPPGSLLSRPVRAGGRRAPRGAAHARGRWRRSPGPPWILLVAPDENLVWGGATSPLRDGLENIPEKTLFPGLAILALAIAGLSSPAYPRWLRRGLGVGVVVVSVLALGFQGGRRARCGRIGSSTSCCRAGRRSGFPGRLVTFSSLGLALLAGAGAQRAMLGGAAPQAVQVGRGAARSPPLLVAGDRGRGTGASLRPVRQPGPAQGAAGAALRRLGRRRPSSTCRPSEPSDNRRYLLWSTDGFPEIVNGRSSLNPAFTERLIERRGAVPRPAHGRAPVAARGEQRDPAHQPRQRHALGGRRQAPGRRPRRSPARDRGDAGRLRDPLADRGAGRDQALGARLGAALAVAEHEQRGRRRGRAPAPPG